MLIHLLNLFRCGAVIISWRGAVFRDAVRAVRAVRCFVQRTARGARGVCGAVFRDTECSETSCCRWLKCCLCCTGFDNDLTVILLAYLQLKAKQHSIDISISNSLFSNRWSKFLHPKRLKFPLRRNTLSLGTPAGHYGIPHISVRSVCEQQRLLQGQNDKYGMW